MIFPTAVGSKDILVNDMVFITVDTSDGDIRADSYKVLALGSNGVDLQVKTMDNKVTEWLTTTQIIQVWRAV
jgi:hypothetical protein